MFTTPEQIVKDLTAKKIMLQVSDGDLKLKAEKGALTPALIAIIKENKATLVDYLKELNGSFREEKSFSLPQYKRTNGEEIPLSFSQQRLWFLDKLQGGTPEYNLPIAFTVKGKLDVQIVESVLTEITRRHEILRTVYSETENGAQQVIHSDFTFSVTQHDLSHLGGEKQDSALKQLLLNDAETPFDLSSDLMMRASYVVLNQEDEYRDTDVQSVLLFNMHHIASDGWSMEVLTKEFFSLYPFFVEGKSTPLPELDIQYADYAHWQREKLQGEVLASQLNYWDKQLGNAPSVHSVPLDKPRPTIKGHTGGTVLAQLPAATAIALQALAKHYQLTPFMLLHSALALVLSRHSNSDDIVIATPVANRMQAELEPLIGFFVNTLVLRVNTQYQHLDEYLTHVRQVHLDAQANQDVPFEQLVDRLNIPRSTAHTALFQIMLTTNTNFGLTDDEAIDSLTLPGATLSPIQSSSISTKFDLDIDISLNMSGVFIRWTYDSALFTQEHIEQMTGHLGRLLTGLASQLSTIQCAPDAQVQLTNLPMLSETETEHLLYTLNSSKVDYPKDKCIHELFEQQVKLSPESIALVFEDQQLTYQALNEKANQLAHYLIEHHHITPDSLIGLCLERSIEMVIGVLGILKAGGAYVPLDPSYPQERLNYVLKDTSLNVVLMGDHTEHLFSEFTCKKVHLDTLCTLDDEVASVFSHYPKYDIEKQQLGLTSKHLSYVIYTSGSTGNPKGVLIEHANTVSMLSWAEKHYSKDELASVLASTSLNFDLSVYELFLPLSVGTKIVLVKNIMALYEHREWDVTLINTVPSAAKTLIDVHAIPRSTLVINLAGEALSANLVNSIFEQHNGVNICNLYGPSEDTTYSTYARFDKQLKTSPHIGTVISNSQAYVLDNTKSLVVSGGVGELYLGGDGLARGYLNLPQLTAERFIRNPFYDGERQNSSMRLYKTGDLVRYLPCGEFEFLGRMDDQVKIRGFRIELGEIEYQLSQLENVDSAIVVAKGSIDEQLVAYIKPTCSLHMNTLANQSTLIASIKLSLASS
ncbi:non-ribosomal peptide synthetase, partial [Pseudoalteromonas sp. NBT06-2]|uniref:non-ribosomal peptide synthetase n=1 Tax=Pseudoalteromonas sp. NBT06-2 TaxID=2025950 RepID=UPI000BD5E591